MKGLRLKTRLVVGANSVPNVFLNHALDVIFHDATKITTWYVGLIEDTDWSAFAAADTMASHAGWTECTSYDEATRQEWPEGAASSQSITNAVTVDFTMSATKTVKGFFLTDNTTKGGSSGTLGPCFLFAGGDRSVVDDDVIKVTATASSQDDN